MGETRQVTVAVSVDDAGGDTRITGHARFLQTDFGVKPYSKLGALKVKDEVEMNVVVTLSSACYAGARGGRVPPLCRRRRAVPTVHFGIELLAAGDWCAVTASLAEVTAALARHRPKITRPKHFRRRVLTQLRCRGRRTIPYRRDTRWWTPQRVTVYLGIDARASSPPDDVRGVAISDRLSLRLKRARIGGSGVG